MMEITKRLLWLQDKWPIIKEIVWCMCKQEQLIVAIKELKVDRVRTKEITINKVLSRISKYLQQQANKQLKINNLQ